MTRISRLRRVFRFPWRGRTQTEAEVDDELAFHLDMRARELMAAEGLTADDAQREARRRFGDLEYTRRYCRELDTSRERAVRRGELLSEIAQDARFALRQLRKSPGFTAVAVATLALGIGATTAIFSAVDGVLLRPLPYADPSRVVTVWQSDVKHGVERGDVSPANFLDLRDRSRSFAALASAEPYGHDMIGRGEPESFRSWLVSEGFFEVLGARAMLGRTFLPEEYAAGVVTDSSGDMAVRGTSAVVLSYGLWERRFGADSGIVGQTLTLDGAPHTVVGVMPPEFQFPARRELWAPRAYTENDRHWRAGTFLNVVGRLKAGVTADAARAELNGIAAALAREYPRTNAGVGVTVVPLADYVVGGVRPALLVMLGAVGFVLLIACANVANLLLAQGARRRHEFALRGALGASRLRLVRQLATESVLLALVGSAAGLLVAHWGVKLLVALSPGDLPRVESIGLHGSVLAFALATSLATALLFGLAPALHFSRPDVRQSLAGGGRGLSGGPGGRRLRHTLVVAETALALVLLIGAGLLARSFVGLLRVDPGFSPEGRVALQFFFWDRNPTPARRAAFVERAVERIAALPGVRAAGATSALPFGESRIDPDPPFAVVGRPEPAAGEEPTAYVTIVTPGYFAAMGTPLRRGRLFTRADGADAPPVVLINEAMARRYWPGEDPVGQGIVVRGFVERIPREVVGVVADARQTALEGEARPELFVPHAQDPYGGMTFVVRGVGDPLTLVTAAKQAIWSVDKDLPVYSTATMEGLLAAAVAPRRFNAALIGGFALLALVLAAVGIYGVISFTSAQRTREFGVRLALGARRRDLVALTLREGLALAGVGVAAGVLAALALTRLLRAQLYGVSPTDPLTFGALAAVLLAVAALACYLPARRAARADPMAALRIE